MFMTAAGTVPPAKVLVMGAGVAGLQAIATARRLGAVVRAYDVRAAAKEEVQSLGAKFVELDLETQEGAGGYAKEQSAEYLARQQELLAAEVAASDVVITTAADPRPQGPGPGDRPTMVEGMCRGIGHRRHGRRLAAATASCRCPARTSCIDGVTVVGLTNPPASMPTHASFLYARNIANFLGLLVKDGELRPRLRRRDRGRHLRGPGRAGRARPDGRGAGPGRPGGPMPEATPTSGCAEPQPKEHGS